jgi:hypothetical protein
MITMKPCTGYEFTFVCCVRIVTKSKSISKRSLCTGLLLARISLCIIETFVLSRMARLERRCVVLSYQFKCVGGEVAQHKSECTPLALPASHSPAAARV